VSDPSPATSTRLAELVDVSDAGHMVAGDRNDVFTAAILAFLDRVPAGEANRP
jgi:pimeloyl-ACP methyl ester carboxylesterase